jgi:Tol biopolymer transport system component
VGNVKSTERNAMSRIRNTILFVLVALLALPAVAAARSTGAVVFSRVTAVTVPPKEAPASKEGEAPKTGEAPKPAPAPEIKKEGGIFAVRDGRLNQLTENPADTEPSFSPDGRTIAFVREGDVYSVRADGSGERHLTSGAELDSAPVVSPNGRFVVFERQASAGAPADLYTAGTHGGGVRPLVASGSDEHDPTFSPDGKLIVFVSSAVASGSANTADDLYSVLPNGSGLRRLTSTGVDEFSPRFFAGGIVYSRGESSEGPAAYADVYTMRTNGSHAKALVSGVGSAYVEDVSRDGKTVLFRRDRGLWVKRIGKGKARKLTELPDGSKTNSVFSSDGKSVAAIVEAEGETRLVAISVANGRSRNLASGTDLAEGGSEIGPTISWQPVPQPKH